MTKQLSSKERMDLLRYLKENAKHNSSLEEIQALTEKYGNPQPLHRVQQITATLRRIAPDLFQGKRGPAIKIDEIRRLAVLVRPFIQQVDPTAKLIHTALGAIGHVVSLHTAKQVKSSLKDAAPELFSEQRTKEEIREMAEFLRPHVNGLNPTYDRIQEIASSLGRNISYRFCQYVRADLRKLAPELFTGKEARQQTSRTKRWPLRLNVNEADYKIYSEFVEMLGLTQVESLSVLARALLYLTVTQNINLVQVLAAAKNMTNVEAVVYSEIFAKLDLSNI
jgi:hypothetical protein